MEEFGQFSFTGPISFLVFGDNVCILCVIFKISVCFYYCQAICHPISPLSSFAQRVFFLFFFFYSIVLIKIVPSRTNSCLYSPQRSVWLISCQKTTRCYKHVHIRKFCVIVILRFYSSLRLYITNEIFQSNDIYQKPSKILRLRGQHITASQGFVNFFFTSWRFLSLLFDHFSQL